MVSMKLRRKGSVKICSVVLWRESKVRGRSRNTSGWVSTKGRDPAVVARKPASCLRLRRDTAVVEPPRVLSLALRAFHSLTAFGPSSALSMSRSSNF